MATLNNILPDFFKSILSRADGEVKEYPIVAIDQEDIVDTNGAGDAFVGGKTSFNLAIKNGKTNL